MKEEYSIYFNLTLAIVKATNYISGASQGFLKGGSNISLFPKKKSSDFKRGGGVKWSDGGGGVQYISLTRTTNLAYLDAKE